MAKVTQPNVQDAPAPKPIVVSTATTWEMDGTQHPSLSGPLRLPANVPTEVETSQVEYLLSLFGVVLLEQAVEPLSPSNLVAGETATPPEES